MADSRCCFGCSNVRKGAWVISIFDMLICILLTVRTLVTLNFTPYPSNLYRKYTQSTHKFGDETITYQNDNRSQLLENDFIIFNQLFILFLFFYVNLNLKRATYVHNAQSINLWLVTNTIFFVFFILFIGFTTIKNVAPEMVPIGIPICLVVVYQIYVVKCFYDDELKFLACSDRNIIAQPTLQGPPYVTISNQTMQAPTYSVQAGPYVIPQVHQPAMQTPYPQQTYSYHQSQQLSSQSHVVLPPMESHAPPQEYCNPPPYSPNYNTHEGPSVKQ